MNVVVIDLHVGSCVVQQNNLIGLSGLLLAFERHDRGSANIAAFSCFYLKPCSLKLLKFVNIDVCGCSIYFCNHGPCATEIFLPASR